MVIIIKDIVNSIIIIKNQSTLCQRHIFDYIYSTSYGQCEIRDQIRNINSILYSTSYIQCYTLDIIYFDFIFYAYCYQRHSRFHYCYQSEIRNKIRDEIRDRFRYITFILFLFYNKSDNNKQRLSFVKTMKFAI